MKVYPVFLVGLEKKRCVVVGGGAEAERKVEGLLDCDAAVTVIGAEITARLREWADAGSIAWVPRTYERGDLRGAFLVIVAGGDARTHALIREEAEAERALVNVMDDPARCDFVAGSVVRRGPLRIAVSTSGCAPALAVRLRERLEREFGPEFAKFLGWMEALRGPMAARHPDFETRRGLWYELVDSDVIDFLREGQEERARERVAEIVGFQGPVGVPGGPVGPVGVASLPEDS
ncbi:MAG: bifunctional precorrin-2 dehydrogenase/sirohydrochlorin ferrochelatase [Nitrospinota bacterium]